jgi:hypothetical protein
MILTRFGREENQRTSYLVACEIEPQLGEWHFSKVESLAGNVFQATDMLR